MKGVICILHNPLFPGHLTIRKSTSANNCIREVLTESTSVQPSELRVCYEKAVSDCELLERMVYSKLASKKLHGKRDKFNIAPDQAIELIKRTIASLNNGEHQLTVLEHPAQITNREWWNALSFAWKNILKSSIEIEYNPTDDDILRGIHNAIDNSGDKALRSKIANLILDKYYTRKISDWYDKLGTEKAEFNAYLPYELADEDLDKITQLTQIDCRNTWSVIDLKPVERLTGLHSLNCSNTSISDLSSLSKLPNLSELIINYTYVTSFVPLHTLKTLKRFVCHGIEMSNDPSTFVSEVKKLSKALPTCTIDDKSFLGSPPETTQRQKRRKLR